MSARAAVLVAAVAVVLGAGAGAGLASAEPVSAAARARAEKAFASGHLDDVDAAVGAGTTLGDLEPLVVRDGWWRPRDGYLPPVPPPDDASLSARRIRWVAAAARSDPGPYPTAGAGEVDLYPVLTALVLDRLDRETVGGAGFPRTGRLWDAADPDVRYVWRAFGSPAYEGPKLDDYGPEDRVAAERAQARYASVVARNRGIAAGAVGGFTLAALLLGAAVGRRRKSGPPTTDP